MFSSMHAATGRCLPALAKIGFSLNP